MRQKLRIVLKLTCQSHHIGAIVYLLEDIQNWSISKQFELWPINKKFAWPQSWQIVAFWMRLSIPNITHSTSKQRWTFHVQDTRKGKEWHFSWIFAYFWLFLVILQNFTDIFAAIDTTSYFKEISIAIFVKKLFSDDW